MSFYCGFLILKNILINIPKKNKKLINYFRKLKLFSNLLFLKTNFEPKVSCILTQMFSTKSKSKDESGIKNFNSSCKKNVNF